MATIQLLNNYVPLTVFDVAHDDILSFTAALITGQLQRAKDFATAIAQAARRLWHFLGVVQRLKANNHGEPDELAVQALDVYG